MKSVDFKKLEEALFKVQTLYQQAIMDHGVKELAWELKKSDKTIYAELSLENLTTYLDTIKNYDENNKKPSYLPKLGLVDFAIGILLSGNTRPLVALASLFNLACFPVPGSDTGRSGVLQLLKNLNKEYAEGVNETLSAVEDNNISVKEARRNIDEIMDIINAAGSMKAYYENIVNKKGRDKSGGLADLKFTKY